jgi:putative aldouronate transport system substrate-binding protein
MMPLPITLREGITPLVTRDAGYRAMQGIGISATSRHQELAFDFLNFIASEEGQILLNWGIEGMHYEYDENGVRRFLPEIQEEMDTNANFASESGVGWMVYPFPMAGNAAIDSSGNPIMPGQRDRLVELLNPAQRETLEAFDAELMVDLFPDFSDYEGTPWAEAWTVNIPAGSRLALLVERLNTFTQQAITQAILTTPEEFDAAWDAIIAEMQSIGVEEANELFTELIQQRIKLWQ